MKPRFSNQRNQGLTLVDVMVILVVLAGIATIVLPALIASRKPSRPINCVNNLQQIGLSFRIWSDDNTGKYPMQISATNGGTQELALSGDVKAIYRGISNELSTPKILICPADQTRFAATNFTTDLAGKISYFVAVDADEKYPQMALAGDDNFAIGGVPVKSGLLEIMANTPIAWTAERHKFVGNICIADGSVQQLTAAGLIMMFQQTGSATNRLAIP